MKLTIAGVDVVQDPNGKCHWTAGMMIDGDGSPRMYGPKNSGLDWTANGGKPGNWWALICDDKGDPVIQGAKDPCPGMYISTTSYERAEFKRTDPRRYVDSGKVPYVVVPPSVRKKARGVVMGCRCLVTNIQTGVSCEAVVADIGPSAKIGEGSIALAKALGINHDVKKGGTERKIIRYEMFPGTPAKVNGEQFKLIPA